MRVGVLALQGSFIEHIGILRQLGVEAPPIRLPHELDTLDGLIIPGGESTTMLRLMESFGLIQPIREMARDGLPIWGTCAGMVCLPRMSRTMKWRLCTSWIRKSGATHLAARLIALRQNWRYRLWAMNHSTLFSFELRSSKKLSQM